MNRALYAPLCAAGLLLAAFLHRAAQANELLTLQQVEKVTGLTGLSVNPSRYNNAGISFINERSELAVAVKTESAEIYAAWKAQPAFPDQTPLKGIGQDAFTSKTGRYLCFKKAKRGVCVMAMVPLADREPMVNDEQLLRLAKLVAKNLSR